MPVILTNDFPPDVGGIQRVMSRIAAGLAAHESKVWVVAPWRESATSADRRMPFRVLRYRVFRDKFIGMLAMIPTFLKASRRANDGATIASIWWPSGLVVALMPRRIRGRFAVLAYGSEIAPSRGGLRRHVMRFVYQRADVVLAISEYTERLLAQVGITENVQRITLAVDATPIEPARSPQPVLLSVGRLIHRKGFDRTIEALAIIAARHPTVQHIVVGSGPQRAELERRTRELGLGTVVTFRGSVSDEELRALYAQAWLFVLPTRRINDDVEGFGLVYLEAAMAEVPSIGGLESGASDAIDHMRTGLLIDGDDTHAIAEAITLLLTNDALRLELGKRAFRRSLDFTWAKTTNSLRDALKSSTK